MKYTIIIVTIVIFLISAFAINNRSYRGPNDLYNTVEVVTGYYSEIEREGWEGEAVRCNVFVVEPMDQKGDIIENLLYHISYGNTVNSIDANGNLEVNIDFSGVSENKRNMIRMSSKDNKIDISLQRKVSEDGGVPSCFSFVTIVE